MNAATKTFKITVDAGIVVKPTTSSLSNVFDATTGVLNSDVNRGDTITFSAETYTDVGALTVNRPLTLIGNSGTWEEKTDSEFPGAWNIPGAVVIGAIRLIITSSDVTVKGFIFRDTGPSDGDDTDTGDYKRGVINPSGAGLSNIVIEKNEFNNTHTYGVYYTNWDPDSLVASNFTVSDNKFEKIGHNDSLTKVRNKESPIYTYNLIDSSITGNKINNTTWSGMNLSNIKNFTISDNVINGVPKTGIQIHRSLDANTTISGNTISNANNDLTRVEVYSKYGAARSYSRRNHYRRRPE